ncbi:hypothetical protein [uncultured Desulfobulbus sp.]|uniref:hypothetical protein n=1 Tax=uncultured Desulfobulbus sp. TaxID=239745 RepID=UPI0029C63AA4|nr:hypothetical protein [uncultured Desulfobulbus sp.]
MTTNLSEPIYNIRARTAYEYQASLAVGIPMALILFLAKILVPYGTKVLMTSLWVGISLSVASVLLLEPWFKRRRMLEMRPLLIERCKHLYDRDLSQATFVGVSLNPTPQSYGGDTVFDIGFIVVEADRIYYYGDSMHFEISYNDIINADLYTQDKHKLKNSISGYPNILVTWRKTPVSHWHQFLIEIREPVSKPKQRSMATSMIKNIETYKQNITSEPEKTILPSYLSLNEMPDYAIAHFTHSCLLSIIVIVVTAVVISSLVILLYGKLYSEIKSLYFITNITVLLLSNGIDKFLRFGILQNPKRNQNAPDDSHH